MDGAWVASVSRRDAIRLGLLGGAGLLLPVERADDGHGGREPEAHEHELLASPASAAFRQPLRIPPVLRPVRRDATTDYYQLAMRPGRARILPGKQTAIWGYDGRFPGPTIRAKSGRRVVVTQQNGLQTHTAVHLHGGHAPAAHDGGPMDHIHPGRSRRYVYPNRQVASTLWYHDHAMGGTAENVYRGLAGFYLIGDDAEARLNLPSGPYDVPLMIQDRAFERDGSLSYPSHNRDGFEGDTIVVNGVAQPYFRVANRKYRLRLLNASNARRYELALSSGEPLAQVATDGGLLPAPVARRSVTLAPGERAEVVVDFGRYAAGSRVVLRNTMGKGGAAAVMRFDVVRGADDTSALPVRLRPLAPLPKPSVARTFVLGYAGQSRTWVINGNAFDPDRVDARPKLGSAEVWTFTNTTGMPHPVHLHLAMFRILDRNGKKPPPWEAGWKDTVNVRTGETVRVAARFADYPGRYVFHCHNLEHEDYSMMGQFEVVR